MKRKSIPRYVLRINKLIDQKLLKDSKGKNVWMHNIDKGLSLSVRYSVGNTTTSYSFEGDNLFNLLLRFLYDEMPTYGFKNNLKRYLIKLIGNSYG